MFRRPPRSTLDRSSAASDVDKRQVLILPTFDRDAEILGAIEAGAAGYLLKEVDPDVIIDGIQRAAAGDTVLAPDLASRVLKGMRSPLPRLTDREIDVLRLLATGSANKEIARALFVTEATVKSHLVHIFTKLGVDSRSRAIHVAQETLSLIHISEPTRPY